jgi:hypothetical protein
MSERSIANQKSLIETGWFASRIRIEQPAFPHFFVVGPARTASTWLHNILEPHVHLPVTYKETRFFDLLHRRGMRWYRAQFGLEADNGCFGEVAPTYFHSSLARVRIRKCAPDARVICTLRDPVERLYSLFRYKRFLGNNRWTFEYAITHDKEMIESARYAHYLKAWINDFGRSRVLVTIYDDLERDPQGYVDSICDFIRISLFSLRPSQRVPVNGSEEIRAPSSYFLLRAFRFMVAVASSLRFNAAFKLARRIQLKGLLLGRGRELPPLSPVTADALRKRLTPEIEEVEDILGRDLPAWKAS